MHGSDRATIYVCRFNLRTKINKRKAKNIDDEITEFVRWIGEPIETIVLRPCAHQTCISICVQRLVLVDQEQNIASVLLNTYKFLLTIISHCFFFLIKNIFVLSSLCVHIH